MSLTIGLLTIGQAPRPDGLARDVGAVVAGAKVLERGALDGLTREQVAAMRPSADDYRLVTLMSDGGSVQIAKRFILPRLQEQIEALEDEGADVTLLMCTGAFPTFQHRRPLLAPQAALYGVVKALAVGGRVGALTPLAAQVEQARGKWSEMGVPDTFVTAADPYCDDPVVEVRAGAARSRAAGATVLFLDCFGYDLRMKRAATEAFGGPVVLARSMAARLAAEVAL